MITEDYCSYEVAKLLKEKGFEILTSRVYDNQKELDYQYVVCWQEERLPYVSAPTLQMAMKWLREVHNIFIVIEPHMYDYINEKTSSYVTSLWQGDNYHENITSKDYPTYEEAVEATLKYCLENLI